MSDYFRVPNCNIGIGKHVHFVCIALMVDNSILAQLNSFFAIFFEKNCYAKSEVFYSQCSNYGTNTSMVNSQQCSSPLTSETTIVHTSIIRNGERE